MSINEDLLSKSIIEDNKNADNNENNRNFKGKSGFSSFLEYSKRKECLC